MPIPSLWKRRTGKTTCLVKTLPQFNHRHVPKLEQLEDRTLPATTLADLTLELYAEVGNADTMNWYQPDYSQSGPVDIGGTFDPAGDSLNASGNIDVVMGNAAVTGSLSVVVPQEIGQSIEVNLEFQSQASMSSPGYSGPALPPIGMIGGGHWIANLYVPMTLTFTYSTTISWPGYPNVDFFVDGDPIAVPSEGSGTITLDAFYGIEIWGKAGFSVDTNATDPFSYFQQSSSSYQLTLTPKPDIKILDATTTAASDFTKIKVKYAVDYGDAKDGFVFRAYLSGDAYYDNSDVELGKWTVTSEKARAGSYAPKEPLSLDSKPAITLNNRFIILRADPDEEVDEVDEDNNDMFVIPLFKRGEKGGFKAGSFVVGLREVPKAGAPSVPSALPAISGRISRGTTDYTDWLDKTSVQPLWQANGRSFPLPDPAPYNGDDWTIQPSLLEPLQSLVALIDKATEQYRLPTSLFLTDAFDEEGDHKPGSLHYEGRAIDFDAQPFANERLTGLAMLAGFRWVWHEPDKNNGHVHVSHIGFTAEVSFTALSAALEWGSQNGLVPNTTFKDTLSEFLQQGTKPALKLFLAKLDGAPATKIKPKLQKLLLFNAEALFATLP